MSEFDKYSTDGGATFIDVEDSNAVEKLNSILHTYGEFIIGRMGIPYRKLPDKEH